MSRMTPERWANSKIRWPEWEVGFRASISYIAVPSAVQYSSDNVDGVLPFRLGDIVTEEQDPEAEHGGFDQA